MSTVTTTAKVLAPSLFVCALLAAPVTGAQGSDVAPTMQPATPRRGSLLCRRGPRRGGLLVVERDRSRPAAASTAQACPWIRFRRPARRRHAG